MSMSALTVLQPWATMIALGHKQIENRTWRPPAGRVGALLAIHAGKRWSEQERDAFIGTSLKAGLNPLESFLFSSPQVHRLGVVVAVARLAGVVTESTDPWFCGPYGWQLTEIVALPTPVPCRGAQGLWTLPADVQAQVVEQMGVAAHQAACVRCQTQYGNRADCAGCQHRTQGGGA